MSFHDWLLLFLAASILTLFERVRKILLIGIPLTVGILAIFQQNYSIKVLGSFGVSLSFDGNSKIFLIGAFIGFSIVALHILKERVSFAFSFLFLTSFLTLGFLFISNDLFNIYVLMEVLSVEAGLLILENVDEKKLWASLKYLMIGNVGASLYLIGTLLYYTKNGTFEIIPNPHISKIIFSLMWSGILVRTGVFGFGMWLPQFHSNASDKLSALLSGVFVSGGIYVLARLQSLFPIQNWKTVAPFLALAASIFTLASKNPKRALAWSTMSHVTLMTGALTAAPLYSLSHTIAKTILFLHSGSMKKKTYNMGEFMLLLMATLSLIGMPFTIGNFSEKFLMKDLIQPLKWVAAFSVWISGGAILKYLKKPCIKKGLTHSIFLIPAFFYPNFSWLGLVGFLVAFIFSLLPVRKDTYTRLEKLEENTLLVGLGLVVITWLF